MNFYDKNTHVQKDLLGDEKPQLPIGRRTFLQRTVAVGLSASAATAWLAACGNSGPTASSSPTAIPSTKIDLLNVWTGEESASFEAVVAPFKAQTGITINVETTRDVNQTLTARLLGNNPPDIAILPNPGKMQELAKQGKLVALDSFLNMTQFRNDYSQGWIDLGSYNSKLYALFYKAAGKGTVWYSPKQFTANGYTVPTTWAELITLSNQIAASGKYPWSMGVSSAAASGWPAADWIAEIYLKQSGPTMYDKWVNHQIPWTDASIKQAFQTFGAIANGTHYINGGANTVLATGFQEASYLPFNAPPDSYMYYLGDFTAGFISSKFTSAVAGTDYNFFPFPTINTAYAGGVTGGANVVVAMRNTTAVQKLISYMETAKAQEIWVKRGGFTSPNKSVTLDSYPDAVTKASAQMLTNATIFRFGADDLMPSALETAFWKATLTYIQTPDQLDSILSSLESTAASSYTS